VWLTPAGQERTDADWSHPGARHLGVRLDGDAIDELDAHGRHITGDTLLILVNAASEPIDFVLPEGGKDGAWELVVDTADPWRPAAPLSSEHYKLVDHSMAVLRLALYRQVRK